MVEECSVCPLCHALIHDKDPFESIEDPRTPMQKHRDWHKFMHFMINSKAEKSNAN